MSGPDLSVIVPTYNGGWILGRTLQALRAQDASSDRFELIVVDDGSTDGSIDGLEAQPWPMPFRVIRQANRGRAAARNRGATDSHGRILLFLDADIWAEPGLVRAHLTHHEDRRNLGVQGWWKEHPDSLTTMFMRSRHLIPDMTHRRREGLSPYHVVTRNFSIDAEAFRRAGGFDEAFQGYGWEDIELAFRMVQHGVALRFEPAALAYHYHVQTLADLQEKMQQAGEGAVYFWRKHQRHWRLGLFLEIHPALLPLKWTVYRSGIVTAAVAPLLAPAERLGLTLLCGEIYNHLLWRSYYEGVFAALKHDDGRAP
jgi:GT2 family glycosyltransferase